MRTIDARDLDVHTEELLEYLRVNIRMSIPNHEQMIIITPTQMQNIRSAQTGSLSYHERYPASFMGVPIEIKNRTAEEQIDDYTPKKAKTKVSKKETEQPRQQRHVPVWKD